ELNDALTVERRRRLGRGVRPTGPPVLQRQRRERLAGPARARAVGVGLAVGAGLRAVAAKATGLRRHAVDALAAVVLRAVAVVVVAGDARVRSRGRDAARTPDAVGAGFGPGRAAP